jgi:hypothetical protein
VAGRGAEERRRKKAGSASDRGRVVEGGSVAVSRPWSRPSRRPRSWRGPRRQRWPERPRRASPWLSPAHPRQLPARAGSKRRRPRADRPGAKKCQVSKSRPPPTWSNGARTHLGRLLRDLVGRRRRRRLLLALFAVALEEAGDARAQPAARLRRDGLLVSLLGGPTRGKAQDEPS